MRISVLTVFILVATLLGGCSQFWLATSGEKTVSSSLVSYLYPEGMKTPIVPGTPVLKLPLRAGIAFVPGADPQAALQAKGNSLHIWEGGKAILKIRALLPGVGPTNRNISPTPGSRPGAWTPNERISIRIV